MTCRWRSSSYFSYASHQYFANHTLCRCPLFLVRSFDVQALYISEFSSIALISATIGLLGFFYAIYGGFSRRSWLPILMVWVLLLAVWWSPVFGLMALCWWQFGAGLRYTVVRCSWSCNRSVRDCRSAAVINLVYRSFTCRCLLLGVRINQSSASHWVLRT